MCVESDQASAKSGVRECEADGGLAREGAAYVRRKRGHGEHRRQHQRSHYVVVVGKAGDVEAEPDPAPPQGQENQPEMQESRR